MQDIYKHCVLLCSGIPSRDSNLNKTFRSKKGDAQVLALKLQVCVVILLMEKKQKVSPRFFPSEQQRKERRKVNKQNCFRDLAGKHSKAGGAHQPPKHCRCLKKHCCAPISAKDEQKAPHGTSLLLSPCNAASNKV